MNLFEYIFVCVKTFRNIERVAFTVKDKVRVYLRWKKF